MEQINSVKGSPKVAVVVLTLNGRRWLGPCLDSVLASDYPGLKVCLVDNGSSDGSQVIVESSYPSVELIQNPKNLGSSAGFNVGIRWALREGADYVVLLNDDTKVEPGWLGPLVEAAEADPSVGLLSPMHWDCGGAELDPFFKRMLFEETNYFQGSRTNGVDKVLEAKRLIGAAMMMSRAVCEKVGLFDPLYFKHHEETDLCRRARFHGFRVVVVTESRIFHHNRRANKDMREKAPFINVRNIPLYNWKDPEWSIWKKTRAYLGFGMNFSDITDWPLDLSHGLRIAYIQLWILLRLPAILWKTRKERRGPCYID